VDAAAFASGALAQAAWIAGAALLINIVWRQAVRRFTAVGS